MAGGLEPRTQIDGAPVLPDDRAMHRSPAGAVPQQCRLALIGDADRRDIAGSGAGLVKYRAAGRERRGPQVFRLMLDRAIGGKMLRKFLLRDDGNRGVAAKQNGARRGGSLIDG